MPQSAKIQPISEQVPLRIYTKYLEDLIKDPKLTQAAILVGLTLAKGYVAKWGYCTYSIKQIAAFTVMSERNVIKMIKLLEERGYIEVNRDNFRNRYIPNFWLYENEPAREKPKSENRSTKCTPVHVKHVNSSSLHTIEKDSDSSIEESSSFQPKKEQNEPRAFSRDHCAESSEAGPKPSGVGRKVVIRTWKDMEKFVLQNQRRFTAGTGKWDRDCYEESVKRGTRLFAQDSYFKFPCVRLAIAKYTGWLKVEKFKTKMEKLEDGFNDFIEYGEDY